MLNRYARALFTRLLSPIARGLLRLGVSPDAVTIIGTLGVCLGALVLFPQGRLFGGVVVITVFVFSDMIDGMMAREQGRTGPWGAFLDSTLDRFGDAAVFAALAWWYLDGGQHRLTGLLALLCLVLGFVVSYVRARAEGLGMTAAGGVAERADRLVAALVTTGLVGLGLPRVVLTVVLALIALASAATIAHRVAAVHRQSHEARSA